MAEAVTTKEEGGFMRAARRIGGTIADTYRHGGRAVVAAPLLLAIAVVPEGAQHVAEIRLGMFDSVDAFRALANDPTRWAFGYFKVAGFVIAILAVARFWAVGSIRRALLVPPRDLLRLVVALGLTVAASLPFEWAGRQGLPTALNFALQAVSAVIQTGLLLYVAAALFGDRDVTLRTAFTERWPSALVMTLAAAAAFIPAQALHMANHKLAMAQAAPVVWMLMAWDALWVGLLAALVGSALYAGYGCGLTWRGWVPAKRPGGAG